MMLLARKDVYEVSFFLASACFLRITAASRFKRIRSRYASESDVAAALLDSGGFCMTISGSWITLDCMWEWDAHGYPFLRPGLSCCGFRCKLLGKTRDSGAAALEANRLRLCFANCVIVTCLARDAREGTGE